MFSALIGSSEILVDNQTHPVAGMPALAILADGTSVAVWEAYSNVSGLSAGIYMQRYDAAGHKLGSESRVDPVSSFVPERAGVAALPAGGFVVIWESIGAGGDDDIYVQLYDSSGQKVGTQAQVNTYSTDQQDYAAITPLLGGGFVVTWSSWEQDGSEHGVYLQRFDASGAKVGAETRVNTHTAEAQDVPAIAALLDGGFVVAFVDEVSSDYDVHFQRYAANGATVGGQTLVNTATSGLQDEASVAGLANGGFVVTWTGSLGDIHAQVYDVTGAKVGGEIAVNTTVAGYQGGSRVVGLVDGTFVVAWESEDAAGIGLFAQQFNADGSALGTETQVNLATSGDQGSVTLAALPDGGFVAAWHSISPGGQAAVSSYARIFAPANAVTGGAGNDQLENTAGADAFAGGDGRDTVNYYTAAGGVTASLQNAAMNTGEALGDTYDSIENLNGSNFADWLIGNDGVNFLHGFAGNDTLLGGDENDWLYGEDADDVLFGEDGADRLYGQAGNDTLYGQRNNDTLYGEDGNDALFGGYQDDLIVTGNGDDVAYGEEDNDTLFGEAGSDTLVGGTGGDKLYGQDGIDVLFGEDGSDQLVGGAGDDRLYGQNSEDAMFGEAGVDILDGGAGGDLLSGGAGADQLTGGAGADNFFFDNRAEQADFISDFSHAEGDRFVLQGSAFNAPAGFTLTAGVGLLQGAGVTPVAQTATFYFDTSTRALWYDVDGTGGGGANVIAFLLNTPTLNAEDFIFV